MRIISLEAENYKRLKAVQITPNGAAGSVIVSGKNAAGKSSVLDAIWAALAGKDGAVQRPVRDGEKKARVRLDLGEVIVERKWSGERTSLTVTAASGAKFPSPQRMLDDLIGSLSFDPLAFATQEPAKQRKTLIELVPEGAAQLETIAGNRKAAYDRRTEVNRETKRLQGALQSLDDVPDGTPDEEVDVIRLSGELQAATQAETQRLHLLEEWDRNKAEIARLEAEVSRLKIRQDNIRVDGLRLKERVEGFGDLSTLNERLGSAEETNKAVRLKRTRQHYTEAVAENYRAAGSLTTKIQDLDQARDDTLAELPLPVDGLSFDDEGVLYNGIPFGQASAAERLRVSVAMAMALNPNIRVIRITDGSLLDSDNLKLIEDMATDQDFQVWVERVSDGDGVGVRIEDGEVAQ